MKAVIQNYKTGELSVAEAPAPQLATGCVLVRTAHSVISAGTEKTKVDTGQKSLVGKALARPDLFKKVIHKARKDGLWKTWRTVSDRLDTPIVLGYSCAGRVIEVSGDTDGICVGDWVACAGNTANHAELVSVPKNLAVTIPEGVGTDQAAFATLGAIAMQGVRQAKVEIGERVAVIGLGLIGLLTTQILRAAGCRVFGIDVDAAKLGMAASVGCDATALASDSALEERVLLFTDGYGVDATVITAATSSNGPIEQAGLLTREKGRVVVVGLAGMEVPREPFYLKEIDLRISRSYGPGRYDPAYEEHGLDYPYAYVRFTERRNMASFLDLVKDDSVTLKPMITHRFPISEAAAAYNIIRGERKERYLGILLEYAGAMEIIPRRIEFQATPLGGERIRIGVIGAGKYASTHLLPYIKQNGKVLLSAVCTASGVTALHAAEKFRFASAEESSAAVLEKSDAVLIATRHHLHASLALEALRQRKHVFVEKPLAINPTELDQLVSLAQENGKGSLMVGFNRRFAPAVQLTREHLAAISGGKSILIRVNAGTIPGDHWVQDPIVGGGRLIGEGCHFVDLAMTLAGAAITTVSAVAVPQPGRDPVLWEDFVITLRMGNGSIATILYTATGDTELSKEYVEVHSGGRSAVIDDFKSVQLWAAGKRKTTSWANQDKGQKHQMDAWLKGIEQGRTPIPFDQIANVHRACFAAIQSFRVGSAITL